MNPFVSGRAPGTPAYKSPEEYYDEILDLKKQIAAMNTESSTMKSRLRRLEEDNLKKEKEIEQLLDPSKSDDMRRTLTDRKPDSSTVSTSSNKAGLSGGSLDYETSVDLWSDIL